MANYQDYNNQAQNTYSQAIQNAMPSQQSFDSAAARVRSRIASRQNNLDRASMNQYAGTGNVGGYDYSRAVNKATTQNEYSTALTDLQNQFEQQKQTGAGILNTAASGLANMGQNQYSTDVTRELGLGNIAQQKYSTDTSYNLGQQQIAQQKYATDLENQVNKQKALNELMQVFGQVGNIRAKSTGRGAAFDTNYTDLINQIFGAYGIDMSEIGDPYGPGGSSYLPAQVNSTSVTGGNSVLSPFFRGAGAS